MSAPPSCAMIEPSMSSTIEWTIDCGWMTTSICAAGRSNSQCASITSRPLFISVAESMVILRPIRHVGCRNASSGLAARELRRRHFAERPARSRQDDPLDLLAPAPMQTLMNCVVLAVYWKDRDTAGARRRGHERTRHHEHFLVGQRDGFARVNCGEDSLERRRAGRRADDDVGVACVATATVQPARTARSAIPTSRRECLVLDVAITFGGTLHLPRAGRHSSRRPAPRPSADRDAPARHPARSARSIRSIRGWPVVSCA